MSCSVLQYVVVCCSVLQCVAVCCSVHTMQRTVFPTFRKRCVALCCGVLQCAAVCCSVLEVWCSGVLSCVLVYAMYILSSAGYCQHSGSCVLQSVAVCCSVLRCATAVCCRLLQKVAVYILRSAGYCQYSSALCCNVLQRVAASCSVHTMERGILPTFRSDSCSWILISWHDTTINCHYNIRKQRQLRNTKFKSIFFDSCAGGLELYASIDELSDHRELLQNKKEDKWGDAWWLWHIYTDAHINTRTYACTQKHTHAYTRVLTHLGIAEYANHPRR